MLIATPEAKVREILLSAGVFDSGASSMTLQSLFVLSSHVPVVPELGGFTCHENVLVCPHLIYTSLAASPVLGAR